MTSEFGDKTQLLALGMSAIYDFKGVLAGSCLALFCSCVLGVFYGKQLSNKLNIKLINFLLGCTMIVIATNIGYQKKIKFKPLGF